MRSNSISQTVHYNSDTEFGGCWFVFGLLLSFWGFLFCYLLFGVFNFVFVLVVADVLIWFGLFICLLHILKTEFSECVYYFLKLPTCVDWK